MGTSDLSRREHSADFLMKCWNQDRAAKRNHNKNGSIIEQLAGQDLHVQIKLKRGEQGHAHGCQSRNLYTSYARKKNASTLILRQLSAEYLANCLNYCSERGSLDRHAKNLLVAHHPSIECFVDCFLWKPHDYSAAGQVVPTSTRCAAAATA